MNWKVIWKRIRLMWVTLGIVGTIIYATWLLIAYRPTPEAHAVMQSIDYKLDGNMAYATTTVAERRNSS